MAAIAMTLVTRVGGIEHADADSGSTGDVDTADEETDQFDEYTSDDDAAGIGILNLGSVLTAFMTRI